MLLKRYSNGNFSIYPQYDYTDDGRVLRGYRVNNTVSAKVRALESLSDIIDDAAGAGGDIVVVIRFNS